MDNMIKFAKLHYDAVIPSKRDEDSDYDLYPCFAEEAMVLQPFTTTLVPTGLISAFSEEYGVVFEERGSNAKWNGIIQAGVIDSGYRGEWFVAVYNGNKIPVYITKATDKIYRNETGVFVPYTKAICQFNVRKIEKVTIAETSVEQIRAIPSARGDGCLGSSGK